MKLLSIELLEEFGFKINELKSDAKKLVMSRDNVDIVFQDGHFYYSFLGIDYPLKDLAGLRKFYKENKNQDLTSISN